MNEEGEVREANDGVWNGQDAAIGASVDAGGPNLGGVFKQGDEVLWEDRNMRFLVVNAAGAVLILKFQGFIHLEGIGGVASGS